MIVGVSLLWFYLMRAAADLRQRLAVPDRLRDAASAVCGADLRVGYPAAAPRARGGGSRRGRKLDDGVSPHCAQLLAPSLLASLLYVALRSFREYAASIFLSAPGNQVFSVLVLDMWDTGNFSMLSAYVTMVIVLLGAIVGVFQLAGAAARRTNDENVVIRIVGLHKTYRAVW